MPISIVGNGSITGLTAGGLPDASVVDLDLATGISASKISGTHTSFTSTGIDDNATSVAITIDSSEYVGIGTTTPRGPLDVPRSAAGDGQKMFISGGIPDSSAGLGSYGAAGTFMNTTGNANAHGVIIGVGNNSANALLIGRHDSTFDILKVKGDGRGLSQFTAKAWCNFNQTGTQAIRDSHNISSISDQGTGWTHINFSNNLGNSDYCPFVTAHQGHASQDGNGLKYYGFDMNQTKNTSGYRVVIGNQQANNHSGSNKTQYDEPNAVTMVFGD
jgi:hypothetical protein